FQLGAKAIGNRFTLVGEAIAHFANTLLLFLRVAGKQIGGAVGAAFIELGDNHAECFKLLFNNGVDGNGDFRLERIRFLKRVGVVEEHRIVFQGRNVGAEKQSRSEEHTSELQSPYDLVCRRLLEKKKK